MANPFCHMELQTDDVDKARGFYSELFDWEVEEMPMGEFTYTMMKPNVGDPQVMGGIMPKQAPDAPNHWLSYIAVEDVDATLAKARDLGGNVLADKWRSRSTAGWVSCRIRPAPCSASGRPWKTATNCLSRASGAARQPRGVPMYMRHGGAPASPKRRGSYGSMTES